MEAATRFRFPLALQRAGSDSWEVPVVRPWEEL